MVFWWTLQKVRLRELTLRLVQIRRENIRIKVRVNTLYSGAFSVYVSSCQDSVLSLVFFIIVLGALTR